MAFWEHGPNEQIWANLRMLNSMHWWVFDKERTNHPYIACLNAFLYHRRYWDCYGDLPDVPPNTPGDAELEIAKLYNEKNGPRVAVPMRFGQNGGREFSEPFWQLPSWRTDAYAESGGGRRM